MLWDSLEGVRTHTTSGCTCSDVFLEVRTHLLPATVLIQTVTNALSRCLGLPCPNHNASVF
eukprot:3263157-Amphidinium_carterae.1